MSDWQALLLEPARAILTQIGQFVIKLIVVIFVLIVGWLISKVIRTAVTRIAKLIKFDDISASIGVDDFLAKGGISYSLSELLGVICYWLAMLVTFLVALTPFNLITPTLLDKIVTYIPNVVASIFIVVLGMFVATLLKNIVLTAAGNAGIEQSKVLGKAVEMIIIVFAVIMALEQLRIGIRITELTVGIILGSLGLGLALSFGLGCKDIAGRMVNDFLEKLKRK